jgi:glutaredoxin 3
MAKVEIYTTMLCGFCYRAKALLTEKGVDFIEYDVDKTAGLRQKMRDRSNGARTVPQIFINDQHVGGSDDLAALNAAGKLDGLLAAGN